MKGTLKSQSIVPRLDGIMRDVERLGELGAKPLEEFKANQDNFYLAQFHLRQALEGVFHIGEHILSRLNGGRATEYKEIARKLGEYKIVDRDFANSKLVEMAGYRNRLTHFYAEITQDEMYNIIKDNLEDFTIFVHAIKKLVKDPGKFNLTIE
jgi:uncharacterized protein YutE (UPF0331/DUF86 family)